MVATQILFFIFTPGETTIQFDSRIFFTWVGENYHLVMTMCLCVGFHDDTSNHNDDNDAYQIIRMINLISRVVAVVTIILMSQK